MFFNDARGKWCKWDPGGLESLNSIFLKDPVFLLTKNRIMLSCLVICSLSYSVFSSTLLTLRNKFEQVRRDVYKFNLKKIYLVWWLGIKFKPIFDCDTDTLYWCIQQKMLKSDKNFINLYNYYTLGTNRFLERYF